MLVLVNGAAHGGRAVSEWRRIRPEVWARIGPFEECVATDPEVARRVIRTMAARGEHQFVAAGGDGTVNLLVTELMRALPAEALSQVTVGAIGLGSSNDFHKPVHPGRIVAGVPCRLDFSDAEVHDVGRTALRDATGRVSVRPWMINASVGTTAVGNLLYNRATGLIGWAKRWSATVAMILAAAQALLRAPRDELTIADGRRRLRLRVRNIGVVKNPHFTGCLRYDSPHEATSGDFFVHLLNDMGVFRTAATLAGLARGRFSGRSGTSSWRACTLTVEAARPFPVEADGEITMARWAAFSILPRAIRVCP